MMRVWQVSWGHEAKQPLTGAADEVEVLERIRQTVPSITRTSSAAGGTDLLSSSAMKKVMNCCELKHPWLRGSVRQLC